MTQLTLDRTPAARTETHTSQMVIVTDAHAYRERNLLLYMASRHFGGSPERFSVVAIPNANGIATDPGSFARLVKQIGKTVRDHDAPKVLVSVAGRVNGKLVAALQATLPTTDVRGQEHGGVSTNDIDTLIVTDTDHRLHSCQTILARFGRLAEGKGYGVLALPWESNDAFERVSTSNMALSEHMRRSVAAGIRKIVLVATIGRSPRDGLSPQSRRNATYAKVAWTRNVATAISIGFQGTPVSAAIAILNDSRCKHVFLVE